MTRMLSSLLLVVIILAGCAPPEQTPGRGAERRFPPVSIEVNGLAVTLTRVSPTCSRQPEAGWWEYELSLANRGPTPVAVRDVKLLTASGRYLQPARVYGETQAAPLVGASVAGDVATGAAGIAAGQVVPYGGLVVTAISSLVRESGAENRVGSEQRFRLRHVPGVELAPGGKMIGSVFFPAVGDARSLEIEVTRQGKARSASLPLPGLGM